MSTDALQVPPHLRRRVTLSLVGAVAMSFLLAFAMAVLYALAPEEVEAWSPIHFVLYGVVASAVFIALLIAAVSRLAKTKHPLVTGIAFVVLLSTTLVLAYAWLYVSLSNYDPTTFTEPLTKASSVYFTVTVLSTVGFGDITPVGDTARMVVTSQMILGFTVITIAIRTVLSTTQTAIRHKHAPEIDALKVKHGYEESPPESGTASESPGTS